MNGKEDLYHSCRWCKWFAEGKCTNEAFTSKAVELFPFYEDGVLSEAIKEGLSGVSFNALELALNESSLSKKKVAEIMNGFHEELENAFMIWAENIDGTVSLALEHFDFEKDAGITVADPHTFYCKNFW